MAAGARFFVPEIIHYELRRELLRLKKTDSIQALERFVHGAPDRLLRLASADLILAAELWAEARNRGMPTADLQALDIDVILAAQVRNSQIPMTQIVVATSNSKHLSQFVASEQWDAL